jgi:phytoene dehydrogenase-like protein
VPAVNSDVVIVGAGHNGLVAANYLARAGVRVVVLEGRGVVGGSCVTEELIPGFKSSSCAYVASLLRQQVVDDLELSRFGLELYQTDVSCSNFLPDGQRFILWNELDRTLRDLSKKDAAAFLEFGLAMERFAQLVSPTLLATPPQLSKIVELFERSEAPELFGQFFTLSVKDLLDRFFESEAIKGMFTFFALVSVFGGPRTPGTAYVYGHHSWGEYDGRMGQVAFPRGGMGAISQALARSAEHLGVVVQTNARVARIIVEQDRTKGVVLENGEEIRASVVVSNADPKRTYLTLLGEDDLDSSFRQQVTELDFRGSMARVHIALDGLPDFPALGAGEGPHHRGLTLLGAETEAFERAWDAQRYGRLPEQLVVEFIIQTVHDSTLAPPGQHMLTTGVQQLPLDLEEGTWDDARGTFEKQVIDAVRQYAPALDDHIIGTYTITPLDLEREYGLTGGNIFHGAMNLNQLFGFRPLSGWADYRSPIPGLYLCGAGTHPGGGVMCAAGHNAAMVILNDLRESEEERTRSRGRKHRLSTNGSAGVERPLGGRRHALVSRMLRSDPGRNLTVSLARQRWLRPIVRRLARRG